MNYRFSTPIEYGEKTASKQPFVLSTPRDPCYSSLPASTIALAIARPFRLPIRLHSRARAPLTRPHSRAHLATYAGAVVTQGGPDRATRPRTPLRRPRPAPGAGARHNGRTARRGAWAGGFERRAIRV